MSKGDQTRQTILRKALHLCSEVGLEGLSIGMLAKSTGMSKSGLYAHFKSKEGLQCQVLDAAAERFVDVALAPALKKPRGLPRLRALFDLWLRWETNELRGGCLFVAASTELDDRPGPVRDCLVGHLQDMLGAIARAAQIAVEEGHLDQQLDTAQFAYELWGVLLAHHCYERLLGAPQSVDRAHQAFDGLLERSGATLS